jgi:hypothetical protein
MDRASFATGGAQEVIYRKHEAAVESLQAKIKEAKENAKAVAAKSAEVTGPVKPSIHRGQRTPRNCGG